LLCCSIGSDEDDGGGGSEEASVDDPSETAVSRDAAKEMSSSSTTSSSLSPRDPDISADVTTVNFLVILLLGRITCTGGSVAEWLACWTRAQKGPGSDRSRGAVE